MTIPRADEVLVWILLTSIVGSMANAALVWGFDPPEIPNKMRVWVWLSLAAALARRYVGVGYDVEISWTGNLAWLNLCASVWAIVVWCWIHAERRRPLRGGGRAARVLEVREHVVESERLDAAAEVEKAAEIARRTVVRAAEEAASRLTDTARRVDSIADAAGRTAKAAERTAAAEERTADATEAIAKRSTRETP